MKVLAFTIDLDRDCNAAVPGERGASSRCRGELVPARYDASIRGMGMLADVLRSERVKATVFAEGGTLSQLDDPTVLTGHEVACHGMEHEDLTGDSCGLVPDEDELRGIVKASKEAALSFTGIEPLGFRAPYLNIDPRVLRIIQEECFVYDSSMTHNLDDGPCVPKILPSGLWEFPLTRGRDGNGRVMDSYLWALHEGRRPPTDYEMMIDGIDDGLLVLATHSWHVIDSVAEGLKPPKQTAQELEALATMLGHARDSGFRLVTLAELHGELSGAR